MKTITDLQKIVSLHGAQLVDNYPAIKIYFPKLRGEEIGRTYEVHSISILHYQQLLEDAYNEVLKWAEEAKLKAVTKRMIKEYIQNKLTNDDRWTLKALNKLYERQTEDEQNIAETKYHNNVGFTGHDARYLSSLHQQKLEKGWLSRKQMEALRRTIKKYWSQVQEMSDPVILRLQVLKAQPKAVQLELEIK